MYFCSSGIWTHIAASFSINKGKVDLFINNVNVISTKPKLLKAALDLGTDLSIGAPALTSTAGEFFSGDMDNFYLFNSEIFLEEVKTLNEKCTLTSGGKYKNH